MTTETITFPDAVYTDRLSPRARLSHKIRDGRYRARLAGCVAVRIPIQVAVNAGLLSQDKCYYCKAKLEGQYALDHKNPLDRGGPHILDNLAKTCLGCNQIKHTLTEEEFTRFVAFLEQDNKEAAYRMVPGGAFG